MELNLLVSIVTFSLGSGSSGDVIMSFVADICGQDSEEEKPPKHAHAFGNVGKFQKMVHEERVKALSAFNTEVKNNNFPYRSRNHPPKIGCL